MSVVVKEDQMNEHVDQKQKPQLKPHIVVFHIQTRVFLLWSLTAAVASSLIQMLLIKILGRVQSLSVGCCYPPAAVVGCDCA